MNNVIKPSDLDDGYICFLLDIEYQGVPYRFSTIPIDLQDLAENTIVQYQGGLNDPNIIEKTKFIGIDIEAGNIPLELIFEDMDWVSEWLNGRVIDTSPARISMIIVSEGKTRFTLQDRVGLFYGRCFAGIFGDPNKHPGYIAFSIANNPQENPKTLIRPYQTIETAEFPDCQEQAVGKIIPFVYGQIGPYPKKSGIFGLADKDIVFSDFLHGSPVYSIENQTTYERYILGYGLMEAINIRIFEASGGNFVNPIETDIDSQGRIYSYVQYNVPPGSNIEDNSFNPVGNQTDQYWAQWSEYGGALLNPYSDGVLTGAGDICIYLLQESGLEYDFNAWSGLRSILNRYKFAGYVNDPEVTIFQYLSENIIKWLPIEVVTGGNGLEPKLNLYFYSQQINPSHYVTESGEFEVLTAIQPLEQEIVNHITINYSFEHSFSPEGKYKSTIQIDPEITREQESATSYNHPLAKTSLERYGIYERVFDIPNLYDLETACKIAEDLIRIRALGAYGIEISAASKYGYIQLGDVLAFSSSRLGFENRKCQIISKSWEDGRWHFIIHLEDNQLVN